MKEQVVTTPSIIPFLILLTGLLILLCLVLFSRRTGHDEKPELPQVVNGASYEEQRILEEARQAGVPEDELEKIRGNIQPISLLAKVLSYPIEFYGRVVDQSNNPVQSAFVEYSAFSRFFKDSKKQTLVTDSNGAFAITGIQGGSLFVSVSKEGYYQTDQSQGSFGYAVPSNLPAADNPKEPAILVLHKRGEAEPLIFTKGRKYKVPIDGTEYHINLDPGQPVDASGGDLCVQFWIDGTFENGHVPMEQKPFSWRCQISVPRGGLVRREDRFEFMAPLSGYVSSVEHSVSKTDARWKESINDEDYFVKMPNNSYARIKISFRSSWEYNISLLECYINPTGSRNPELLT